MAMFAQGDIQDNDYSVAYHKGRKAGIKEVVDWMMENYPEVCDSHLEAQLKDWGIA